MSRYKKGATTPSGNIEFQFKAAVLNLKSTSSESQVISGLHARCKGGGGINGGGEADAFRIKITDSASAVIHDIQMDQAEDSDSATPLGGGSM